MLSEIEMVPELFRDRDTFHLQRVAGRIIEFCDANAPNIHAIRHPLGFVNIPLHEHDAYTLRLHLWPEGVDQLPIIHNHVRDLTSYIVTGAIRNLMHEVQYDVSRPSHRLAEVRYEGLRNVMEIQKETVSCQLKSDHIYSAGHIYDIAAGYFHSAFVETSGFTATLTLSGPKMRQRPQILLDLSAQTGKEVVRVRAGVGETRRWLKTLRRYQDPVSS